MEKFITWMLVAGICGGIALSITACEQKQQEIASNTPNGIEENEETKTEQTEEEKLVEETEAAINSILAHAQTLWDIHKEQLQKFIDKGLTLEEFATAYEYGTDESLSESERYQQAYDIIAIYYSDEYQAALNEDHSMFNYEGNVTDNGDGTYTYSESFMNACREKIPYFAGATDQEIADFINFWISDGLEGDAFWQIMYGQEGNLHAENLYVEDYGNTEETDRLEAEARANSEQTQASAAETPTETKPAESKPAESKPSKPSASTSTSVVYEGSVQQEQASSNPEVDKTPSQSSENVSSEAEKTWNEITSGNSNISFDYGTDGDWSDSGEHITIH